MKSLLNLVLAVLVTVAAAGLSAGDAEAKRLGGGSSTGMQRQSVAPRPTPTPVQQATPTAPTPATPAPAPATPKRSWVGPLAGLAAGLGIGALLSHFGLGAEFSGILMFALLAMAAVFLIKLLMRRSAPAERPMQYAGMGGQAPDYGNEPATPSSAPGSTSTANIPAGFDVDTFLRVAKLNFVRLQAANDTNNLDDLREFLTPEMFAEAKLQLNERAGTRQQTDVVTLNADLLEVVTEAGRHIASVRFGGMIRETEGAAATPFDEIWHLVKPLDGSRGWAVAGIQQIN